jgi:nitroimidazol reductase NimA-like FMN-containing flavoprotein (pyridoxamine 5'-phosphate oxidase superfamily)
MSMHLDGNAAGGLLAEVFTVEATTAVVTCAGCGSSGPLATEVVYVSEMGTVVRCANCDQTLIRAAEIRDKVVLDMRGISMLSLAAGG